MTKTPIVGAKSYQFNDLNQYNDDNDNIDINVSTNIIIHDILLTLAGVSILLSL